MLKRGILFFTDIYMLKTTQVFQNRFLFIYNPNLAILYTKKTPKKEEGIQINLLCHHESIVVAFIV